MTQSRFFSSVAIPTTLAVPLGPTGNPVVPVITGLPSSYPFTMVIDWGIFTGTTLIQEAIQVNSAPVVTGSNWTLPCTRGVDGTTAQTHAAGATIFHTMLGQDENAFQAHSGAVSGVHGITGSVVGTSDTQNLTNKTAPTPSPLDNSMRLANTAYADGAVAAYAALNGVPTGNKTSAYTASPGDIVPVDTTSGSVTITFPTAPADRTRVWVKHVIQGGSNTVTYACGGSDVMNKTGGQTSGTLKLTNQGIMAQYAATPAIWFILGDDLSLGSLDSRYATLASTAAPVLTPSFANGTAAQLSDITRDYTLYLEVGTAGTGFTLAIGPTSTPANTLIASTTPTAGNLYTVRIPAGWYVKWAGTATTIAAQTAIGC